MVLPEPAGPLAKMDLTVCITRHHYTIIFYIIKYPS